MLLDVTFIPYAAPELFLKVWALLGNLGMKDETTCIMCSSILAFGIDANRRHASLRGLSKVICIRQHLAKHGLQGLSLRLPAANLVQGCKDQYTSSAVCSYVHMHACLYLI